ncbi:MAG TPA: hypothetical protein VGK99_16120 [Acidobacteriota bacterium]|jgi:hypothetical protein
MRNRLNAIRLCVLCASVVITLFTSLPAQSSEKLSDKEKARQKALAIIEKSIDAMGGNQFRQVKEMRSRGNYFIFKDGQTAGHWKYFDFTRLPDKSRFQLGEGKNKEVTIFNLATNSGWHMEGKSVIKEAKPEEVKQFHETVKHSIDNLLRDRLKEPGMSFFYYGPGELSSKDDSEAVEMIDAENDSVIIYFDVKTHLPSRMEYTSMDARGNKHKEATEFYQWHPKGGILTSMRLDNFTDGQASSQLFMDEIIYNPSPPLSDDLFSKPVVEK